MIKIYPNTFLSILVKALNTIINHVTLITKPWTAQTFYIQKVYLTDHYQILGLGVQLEKQKRKTDKQTNKNLRKSPIRTLIIQKVQIVFLSCLPRHMWSPFSRGFLSSQDNITISFFKNKNKDNPPTLPPNATSYSPPHAPQTRHCSLDTR